MASDNQREFLVLYTHQKTKKSKRWQDGILKVSHQTSRAVLFDDRGCKLDAVYVKPKQVAVGEELESERYLITIEEEKQSGCASEEKDGSEGAQRSQHQQQQHQQQQHQQQQLPKTDFQNRMRIPLKRKRTGFTVPRQVVKKLATANDDVQSGLPSSISHQMKTGMETAPHFGRRAPLFSTPFSKEMEGLSDSVDCAGAVLGSQETKHDHPSMSLNDQSQSYMYQTKENHSCTLPPTMEDSSPPQCYNVDTPKGDRLGHAVLGAPSFCNGLRTFAGLPNAIPDKENVLNLIPKHNIDEKIADLKEGIMIKEQLYRQDHFESQDCVFLSSRETSLPPVQESDQTHSTTAITKPSLPSVGKRSTSQILALLGKGNVKFKPPIKQLDLDRTLKVSETVPHACSADLKTLFHCPVTESPSVMPSEQVLSEDIDVMELLGRADLSTADSCIKPLPDQFDLDSANSSRISHEVLGRCSHETVQGNETHTTLSDNLPKPSTLGETKESVVHVGSTEKLDLSSQVLVRQQYKGFKNPTSPFTGQSSLSSGRSLSGELFFPSEGEVQGVASLKRQVKIPASFPSVASYKQVFTSALKEHLNLILFNLGQRFHTARNKVDTRHLDSSSPSASTVNPQASHAPHCDHGNAAKLVCVKKEGKNKGRFFYACSAPRSNQCKFFMWADQFKSDTSIDAKGSNTSKISLMEPNAAVTFFKGHNVRLYYGCEFRRRASSYNSMLPGAPAWVMKRKQQMMESTKKKLYLNLSRKESSTSYGKDDIWVISKDLTFDPRSTFLAKSVYHGPLSNNDVEIEPLACYSTSNWPSPCNVHAILACNASSELTCLSNLQEHVSAASVPILQSLINNSDTLPTTNPRLSRFKSPAQAQSQSKFLNCPPQEVEHLATLMIETHKLNTDQAKALRKVARMFQQTASDDPNPEPVTLIHGVFGAGKSFLLAVTVLFLVQLFKLSEDQSPEAASQRSPWKLLIASTTNVAVDRILLGLLGLGFEDFIRVGSLRKIAKPVLPYSVHASDKKDSQEIRDLTEMLKTDLTPTEKSHVRRSLERQRLGQNRDLLGSVKVVGVTCAACTFPCMSKLVFPVILLDECSQMTEPSSMLPIARFQSEKLVLVGDPKQLDPTIQGSEAAHSFGLEQTLFNRLIHQGYEPILLRTQYRCHPRISAIANCLFYDQQLQDGVVAEDRPPLTPSLPTLCFFSVPSGKECCTRDGSFYNAEEASFVVYLIEVLLSLGVEPGDVGVITLYKAQTVKINMTLQDSKLTNRKGIKAIQISTVDAFQGGEKGVIILSCVRTDYMGFADSDKRTNVALTRS